MATITELFEQAQLSSAAYSELLSGWSGAANDSYVAALSGANGRMSPEQARSFADKYTVVDQYTDPATGFSGTVFRDATGKTFLAMRGTARVGWADEGSPTMTQKTGYARRRGKQGMSQ